MRGGDAKYHPQNLSTKIKILFLYAL